MPSTATTDLSTTKISPLNIPAPAPVAAATAPKATTAPASTQTLVTTDVPEITPQETESLADGDETVLAANTPTPTPAASATPTTTVATTSGDINESIDTDVVMIKKSTIATSSGLAPIALDEATTTITEAEVAGGVATKPHTLLQIIYTLFGFIVAGLLTASVVVEAKRTRYVQMAYGFGLLAIMAGLWYIHSLLTIGAVIV